MLLKNKKILISAGVVTIVAVPSAFAIWWVIANRNEPVDVDHINNENDVNIVAEQIKKWNSATKTIDKSTIFSRFLPHHIDDKLLHQNYNHVVEAITSESNNLRNPLVDYYAKLQMDYDFYNSPNKIVIPAHGHLRRGTDINLSVLNNYHDSEKGQIALQVSVSKGPEHKKANRQVVIGMKGFHTQSERYSNDVIFAKNAIFRKLNSDPNDDWTLTPPPESDYNFELTINPQLEISKKTPTQIRNNIKDKKLTHHDLAMFDLYPPEGKETEDHTNHRVHNANVTYHVIENDDERNGKLMIKAVISKKNFSDTLLIPIRGFATQDQIDEQVVDDILAKIASPQQTTLTNNYPIWTIGQNLQAINLGIEDVAIDGVIVSYQIVETDGDKGIVYAKALVQKGNIIKEKAIEIKGFRNAKEDKVDDILGKIKNQITWHKNLLPQWKNNDIVSPADLGVASLRDDDKDEFELKYVIKSVNQERGEVDVEVICKYGEIERSIIIKISGYKTRDESTTEKIRDYFQYKYQNVKLRSDSPWTKRLASEAQLRFTSELTIEELKELNIPSLHASITNGASLTYRLVAAYDARAEVTIQVTIVKGQSVQETKFKVLGFAQEQDYNEAMVDKIYQKIMNDNFITATNRVVQLKNNSPYVSKLPSKCKLHLEDKLDDTQLANLNVIIGEFNQVQISAKVWKINDDHGSVEIVVAITFKGVRKDLFMTVQGFKNKHEQDKIDVEALKTYLEDLHKDVRINENSLDKLQLPSEIKSEYQDGNLSINDLKRFNIPIIDDKQLGEAKITYQVTDFNNGSGQITINAQITQNRVVDHFKFYVKGFQTQNDRYKKQIKDMLDKFTDDNQNKVISAETGWNEKRISELDFANNQVLSRATAKKLGIIWDESDLELEWEFRIEAIDDEKGVLTIKVILSKSLLSDATTLTISGFKTSDMF